MEISVLDVSDDRNRVSLQALNVKFVFARKPGGDIRLVSKSKPEAQVHDPDACWVPDNVFIDVWAMAADILKPRKPKSKAKPKITSVQGSLF